MAHNQIIKAFAPQINGGQPYVFHEYPKHVFPNGPDMPFVNVRSADEEAEVMSAGRIIPEADERQRLLSLAEEKGLKVDARWKLERIRAAISNAGYDTDRNAFLD